MSSPTTAAKPQMQKKPVPKTPTSANLERDINMPSAPFRNQQNQPMMAPKGVQTTQDGHVGQPKLLKGKRTFYGG